MPARHALPLKVSLITLDVAPSCRPTASGWRRPVAVPAGCPLTRSCQESVGNLKIAKDASNEGIDGVVARRRGILSAVRCYCRDGMYYCERLEGGTQPPLQT
jgi:hypothetical protein